MREPPHVVPPRLADEHYRASLAAIRRAADLTQSELADRLGVRQNTVSRAERRPDLLWSTLVNYLTAVGGTDVTLSVTIDGQRVDVDLGAREHSAS